MKSLSGLVLALAVMFAVMLSGVLTPTTSGPAFPNATYSTDQIAATISPVCRYTVQPGDWLSTIAPRFHTTWQELALLNDIPDPNWIYVGDILNICIPQQNILAQPMAAKVASSNAGFELAAEPCHSTNYGTPGMWVVPPGCFAGVYSPNPANFPSKPGYGWCNWWPEILHPSMDIFTTPRHADPKLGAVIAFAPGEQGASKVGHWGGEVIRIFSGWVLISEMNMYWRGGGFAKVTYRYVRVEPGVSFVY